MIEASLAVGKRFSFKFNVCFVYMMVNNSLFSRILRLFVAFLSTCMKFLEFGLSELVHALYSIFSDHRTVERRTSEDGECNCKGWTIDERKLMQLQSGRMMKQQICLRAEQYNYKPRILCKDCNHSCFFFLLIVLVYFISVV